MYLSAIESIDGPLIHTGLSESVISGKESLTAESLTSELKLSMYSVISLGRDERGLTQEIGGWNFGSRCMARCVRGIYLKISCKMGFFPNQCRKPHECSALPCIHS